jgi:hypothetical protein
LNAAGHNLTWGIVGKADFAAGLSFFVGCSQETAAKPQQTTAPSILEAKQAPPSKQTLSKTQAYGEVLPRCKEQNEACWAKNRRAHFVIKAAPTT